MEGRRYVQLLAKSTKLFPNSVPLLLIQSLVGFVAQVLQYFIGEAHQLLNIIVDVGVRGTGDVKHCILAVDGDVFIPSEKGNVEREERVVPGEVGCCTLCQ